MVPAGHLWVLSITLDFGGRNVPLPPSKKRNPASTFLVQYSTVGAGLEDTVSKFGFDLSGRE